MTKKELKKIIVEALCDPEVVSMLTILLNNISKDTTKIVKESQTLPKPNKVIKKKAPIQPVVRTTFSKNPTLNKIFKETHEEALRDGSFKNFGAESNSYSELYPELTSTIPTRKVADALQETVISKPIKATKQNIAAVWNNPEDRSILELEDSTEVNKLLNRDYKGILDRANSLRRQQGPLNLGVSMDEFKKKD